MNTSALQSVLPSSISDFDCDTPDDLATGDVAGSSALGVHQQIRLTIEGVLAWHAATAPLPLTTRMCLARDIQREIAQSFCIVRAE